MLLFFQQGLDYNSQGLICLFSPNILTFLVPLGGWVGSWRKSDWRDTASACSCCLCKSFDSNFISHCWIQDCFRFYIFLLNGWQVANRVAEERGALLGHEVGYTIRFDDCSDVHATRIKVFQMQKIDLTLSNVPFGDQTCMSSPVPYRWNAGARDDGRPSSEKI